MLQDFYNTQAVNNSCRPRNEYFWLQWLWRRDGRRYVFVEYDIVLGLYMVYIISELKSNVTLIPTTGIELIMNHVNSL